jgi:glycosyltransferase involved in cell wall biosynthesis
LTHRTAVLHVLGGSARARAHAREALAGAERTRAVVTEARSGLSKGQDIAEIFRLAALAARHGCRLLHCHGAEGAWHAWKASTLVGARYGISPQGADVLVGTLEDPRLAGALVFASMVVVPSQFMADAVLGRAVPHERVLVVPPGVPLGPEPRARSHDVPVVVFTGDFSEQSGVLEVRAALRPLPVRARYVGSGPLLEELPAADVTVTDDPRVQRAALDDADLAVTAGRSTERGEAEAWGRTAVEAQAAGVPVVAARNGGLPQWVTPSGAVLVPSHGDLATSLRLALRDLLDRPGDWAAMGAAGREHVRGTLDVRVRTAELETLWDELGRNGRNAQLAGALVRPPDQF